VTEPADLAHDVLIRVAEFIRKLPADQLADLATGEARLELVPKGGRRAPARATKATGAALPRPSGEIADTIKAIGDRAAAGRYLAVDLKLTVAQLKQLASEFGVTVASKDKKDDIVFNIVERAVGRGLDADVISRVGGGR
jgi:Rho termination factor, N-terminal domain